MHSWEGVMEEQLDWFMLKILLEEDCNSKKKLIPRLPFSQPI